MGSGYGKQAPCCNVPGARQRAVMIWYGRSLRVNNKLKARAGERGDERIRAVPTIGHLETAQASDDRASELSLRNLRRTGRVASTPPELRAARKRATERPESSMPGLPLDTR